MPQELDFIGVDWGTSNVRAWGIAYDGAVLFARSSEHGMGRLKPDNYFAVLSGMLPELRTADRPPEVLICGMAGAKQGWIEAPYMETPASLASLRGSAVRVPLPDSALSVWILPGICQRGDRNDVMRGEETQLLGVSVLSQESSGLVCMPGTHTKWARLSAGQLVSFETSMTGEIFEILRTHSILRHSFAAKGNEELSDDGFEKGGARGLRHPEKLLDELFQVRAGALLSEWPPEWSLGYLSGLLIGSEIGARRSDLEGSEVLLVGSRTLCARYARLITQAGIASRLIPSDTAVLAGLRAARTA